MITLGDCNGCAGCGDGGGVVCDRVAFSNSATGMPCLPAEIVGSATEGNPIAFWVNRYPNCYIYDGDPTDYETNTGNPATDIIPDGQYFFDASARSFWQNQSGTMTAVATPSWFKVGAITGTVKILLPSCSCTAHMITGTADVSFTFADGDDTSVAVSLTTTCPGPPIFWGCQDQPGGLEACTIYFENVSATGGCVTTGHAAQGVVTCTHTLPHRDWGSSPYSIKFWGAAIYKSIGFVPFDWDGVTFPVDRYLSATRQSVIGGQTLNSEKKWADNMIVSPQLPFYEHYKYDLVGYAAVGGPITGATDPVSHYVDYGGGDSDTYTLSDQSGTLESGYLIPDSEINAALANAITNDPDGTAGTYLINQADVQYTLKALASAFPIGFVDPAFDPSKTYEWTGTRSDSLAWFTSGQFTPSNLNPDDWTETAATGFNFTQELVGTPETSYSTTPGTFTSAYFTKASASNATTAFVSKIIIDASNSLTGNPEPSRVFVSVRNYQDGVLVSTDGEVEITDTTFELEITSLGAASSSVEKAPDIRIEYVDAPFCGPSPTPVFVCHPGLTVDPCA